MPVNEDLHAPDWRLPIRRELLLAEVASMRAEILNRSTAQTAIAGLHLTIVGTILGVILNHPEWRDLRLLVAFVSPLLGLLYLDHHETIARLSSRIEMYYVAVALPTYQGESINERGKLRYYVLYLVPTIVLYAVTPALMLFWAHAEPPTTLNPRWATVLWRAGLGSVAFYILAAGIVLLTKPSGPDLTPTKIWTQLPPLPRPRSEPPRSVPS